MQVGVESSGDTKMTKTGMRGSGRQRAEGEEKNSKTLKMHGREKETRVTNNGRSSVAG